MYTSQVDTAAISGTAVGGITALARAGYGRNITASTCGSAIKVLQSRRRAGGATASHESIHHAREAWRGGRERLSGAGGPGSCCRAAFLRLSVTRPLGLPPARPRRRPPPP